MIKMPATPNPPGRAWLLAGACGPLIFLLISSAQLPLNPGFDLTRHAFSFLALGPHGWIQKANFIALGLLDLTAAVGLRQRLTSRLGRAAAIVCALMGAGRILAGICPPDPSFGYPPDAPAGVPDQISLTSTLHAVGFFESMLSWVVLLLILAWLLRRLGSRRWSVTSLTVAIALMLVAACVQLTFGTVLLYAVVTPAFVLTAGILARLATPELAVKTEKERR